MKSSQLLEEFIDSSLFLGMHSQDESVRIASKNFFISRFERTVGMSLEHVGKCDDVIWQCSRELQDAYYPFMDRLHSDMHIARVPYNEAELRCALEDPRLAAVPLYNRLVLAMVLNREAVLYTADPAVWSHLDLPVRKPKGLATSRLGKEAEFSPILEALYRQSLRLRLTGEMISGAG
jgi:Family of unknown function (DUF6190)